MNARKMLVCVAVFLCSLAPLRGQDEIAAMVPKTQAALKDFTCPAGASAQACSTFQKVVAAGSPEIVAQFLPMFDDPKTTMYLIYLAFDHDHDQFWIISTAAAHTQTEGLVLSMVTYGHYIKGSMVTGAVSNVDIPVNLSGATIFNSAKDGVTLSYFKEGDVSVSSHETKTFTNGSSATVDIQVMKTDPADLPLADVTITMLYGGQKMVVTGKAVRFFSPRLGIGR